VNAVVVGSCRRQAARFRKHVVELVEEVVQQGLV
jgi:hypothetical protein